MKLSTLVLTLTLLLPLPALAYQSSAAPVTRRGAIQQGKQILKDARDVKLKNASTLGKITWKTEKFPLQGWQFEYPEDWKVTIGKSTESSNARYKTSTGDFISIKQVEYPGDAYVFLYYKNMGKTVTYENIVADFELMTHQPKTDYESSNLAFIHDYVLLAKGKTTYQGKDAFSATFTSIKSSKSWKTKLLAFPKGSRMYVIKYVAEEKVFDKWVGVGEQVVKTATSF